MYELVNTSVPNGLVAGTHGYATVAMTKGMPDAVRQRVEGFCAYPHRTSAHDASYFTENPVNWFHLVTPGGEHVIGRTAPAEFDYTGRTNRVSRVLYFPEREMPTAGGAAVLLAESARLCEGWSGEPRYLSADGDAAARLRRTKRPVDGGAPNWNRMFGAEGESLARRFAALLAKNLRSGRGIYFKATKADIDGRQLLGLFADLIAFVPEGMAAQVTFSTFAACVSGGVTCHLRGIYDSDRAFETAAALQPWVDCENGSVRNLELLPMVDTSTAAPLFAPTSSDLAATSDVAMTGGETASRATGRSVVGRPVSRPRFAAAGRSRVCVKKSSDTAFCRTLTVGILAVLLAAGIVLLYILEPWKKGRGEVEIRMAAQIQTSELDDWFAKCTNDVAELRKRLDSCETSKDADSLLEQAKSNKQGLKESVEEEGLVGYEDRLRDAEGQYDELIAAIAEKSTSLKTKKATEETRRKKDEDEAKERRRKEEEAQKRRDAAAQANNAVAKAVAEQKVAKKAAEMPFGEINLTEVFGSSEEWTARLSDKDKGRLTDEDSIVYYFPSGGKVEKVTGCAEKNTRKNPMTKREMVEFRVKEPDMKSARWCVAYVPSLEKAYWQWRSESKRPVRLFDNENERADLAKVAFDGCPDEVLEVYQRFLRRKGRSIVYFVSWDDGASSLRVTESEQSIERFKPKEVERKVDSIKREISSKEDAIAKKEEDIKVIKGKFDKLKKHIGEYKSLEEQKKDANKFEDKEKRKKERAQADEGQKKLEENVKDLLLACDFKGKKLRDVSDKVCDEKLKDKRKPYDDDIVRMEKELEALRTNLETEEASLADWREGCRVRRYVVEVVMDGVGSNGKEEE